MRLSFVYLLCVFYVVNGTEDVAGHGEDHTEEVEDETTTVDPNAPGPLEIMLNEAFDEIYRKALPFVTQFGFDDNISADCSTAMVKYALGLRKQETWALQMFDATGKVAPGIMVGTLGDLGNFHECLSATAYRRIDNSVDFTGRFCTMYINMANNSMVPKLLAKFHAEGKLLGRRDPLNYVGNSMVKGVRNSVCIPSACSHKDLEYIANTAAKQIEASISVRGCTAQGENKVSNTQKNIITLIIVIAIIVISCTMLDTAYRILYDPQDKQSLIYRLENSNSQGYEIGKNIVMGISIVSNTEKLLQTEPRDEADQKLMFIHGMRFFSSTWVILGHTYLIADPTATTSLSNVIGLVDNILTTFIANAFPSVETFLFISGFLMSYNIHKVLSRAKNLWLTVPIVLLRRYIRLTVPAMLVVGIWLLVPLMGDGAIMNDYRPRFLESCEKNWWRVLVHTNNFVPFLDMCLGHLWYIDIDYQLYMFLIIIPLLMLKKPSHGIILAIVSTVATTIYIGYVTISLELEPAVVFTSTDIDKTINTTNLVQFRPFAHVGSFNVGILLGYLIYKSPKISLSRSHVCLAWLIAATVNLTVLFKPYDWFSVDYVDFMSPECIIYAIFHRLAWSLGVAWVAFACATGRAGVINRILSWRALVPLSRLSYGAFLSHVVILLTQVMMQEERVPYNHITKTMNYFAVVMASFMCAYVLYLFCEAPVAVIEKTLLGGDLFSRRKRSRSPQVASKEQTMENVRVDQTKSHSYL